MSVITRVIKECDVAYRPNIHLAYPHNLIILMIILGQSHGYFLFDYVENSYGDPTFSQQNGIRQQILHKETCMLFLE